MKSSCRLLYRFLCLAANLLIVAVLAMAPAQAGGRILSLNLCGDLLALALLEPQQIAGLSIYASDPRISPRAEAARVFPIAKGGVESVLTVKADVVLVGPGNHQASRHILSVQGIDALEVGLVTSIDQAREQIMAVAIRLDAESRGRALIERIDAARWRLRQAAKRKASALLIERRGWVSGSSSLGGAILTEARLVPPDGYDFGFGAFIRLERLIASPPDLLVLSETSNVAEDQGSALLKHPAIAGRFSAAQRLVLPSSLSLCSASLPEAMDYLAQQLAARR